MPIIGTPTAPSAKTTKYRISSVSPIPVHHHSLLIAYAAVYAFKQGVNASADSAALWQAEVEKMVPNLVNDVEIRQGSDIETVEAYLEDEYEQ